MKRYSFQPVDDIVGLPTRREVADVFGVSRRTIDRWRANGLDEWEADRVAVKLGTHPASIWPVQWREDGLSPLDDVFVNGGGWRTAWEWEQAS